jgi:hypothetical protein
MLTFCVSFGLLNLAPIYLGSGSLYLPNQLESMREQTQLGKG